MSLAVLAWAILLQISSGQKVKVPYSTEWQLGLSEYIVLYFWNLIPSLFVDQSLRD